MKQNNSLDAEHFYKLGNSKYNLKDYKGACKDWKKSADRCYKPAEKYLNKYC